MHNTTVKMKDGREFCGPIWSFAPACGYLTLIGVDEKIMFKDMISAITENSRDAMREDGTFGDCDEIERARQVMRDLRRTGTEYGTPDPDDLIGWDPRMGVNEKTPRQEWE